MGRAAFPTLEQECKYSGLRNDGDPSRIRTCDPALRRRVLYPTELWGLSADECEVRIQTRASTPG